MVDGNFGKLATDKLLAEQQSQPFGSLKFNELKAEIDRRLVSAQIAAAESQIRAANAQTWAVWAMYLTILAILIAPWLTQYWSCHPQ